MGKLLFLLLCCIVTSCSVNAMEEPPLHGAARDGDIERVKALLLSGACVNEENDWGETSLHVAAQNGHEAIVQLLLENGANHNVYGGLYFCQTPSRLAELFGHLAIVRIINKWQQKQEALEAICILAMATHSRLGEDSPVNLSGVDASIFQNIFKNLT